MAELGVTPALRMRSYDELVQVARPDGEPLTIYTDLDRLEAHMKTLAPGDAKAIEELVRGARAFAEFDLLGLAVASPGRRLQALAWAPKLMRYGRIALREFASRFTDPFRHDGRSCGPRRGRPFRLPTEDAEPPLAAGSTRKNAA